MRLAIGSSLALALAATGLSAQPQRQLQRERVILAIFAHPDDEIMVGPALAAEARRGAKVRIVYATSGDAGPGVSQLPKGAELARVRTAEAQCASAALGLAAPRMLEFGDGQLADYARGPAAEGRDLQASLATTIAAERPDLVITWGPDGGYGHADHRLVGVMVTQAIQALPAQTRPRLVYSAISTASKPLPPQLETWGMTAPDLLDLAIAFEPRDLAAASQATQCHKTQFNAASLPQISPLFEQAVWRGAVRFRSAFPATRARRR